MTVRSVLGVSMLRLVAACSAPATETQVAVAAVPDTELMIGLVFDAEAFVAYVCDGADQSTWTEGTVKDGAFESVLEGLTLAVDVKEVGAEGTITIADGSGLSFIADEAGEDEGVFVAEENVDGTDLVAGWVVLDSAQKGAVHDGATGDILEHPELDVASLTAVSTFGTLSAVRIVDPSTGNPLE